MSKNDNMFTFGNGVLNDGCRQALSEDTIVKGTLISTFSDDDAEYNGETTSIIAITYSTSLGNQLFRCPVENSNRLQDLFGVRFNSLKRYGCLQGDVHYNSYGQIRSAMDNGDGVQFVMDDDGIRMGTLVWLLLRHAFNADASEFETQMAPVYALTRTVPGILGEMQVGIRLSETGREQNAIFGQKVKFVKRGLGNSLAKSARNL